MYRFAQPHSTEWETVCPNCDADLITFGTKFDAEGECPECGDWVSWIPGEDDD